MNDLPLPLNQFLLLLIPVLLIEIALIIFALLDLRKREEAQLRGPKWLWILVIIFVNLLGPIAYFWAARTDD